MIKTTTILPPAPLSQQVVEQLKGDARHFHAGALAAMLGLPNAYGCHYGMRSTREDAAEAFRQGHAEATYWLRDRPNRPGKVHVFPRRPGDYAVYENDMGDLRIHIEGSSEPTLYGVENVTEGVSLVPRTRSQVERLIEKFGLHFVEVGHSDSGEDALRDYQGL
jgi:hypothetical protein